MSDSKARAAEITAKEVENIIAAASKAGEHMKQQVEREVADLRWQVERDAERLREEARRDATAELETARQRAVELEQDARKKAQQRIAEAQKAADNALEEAKALSAGLRQLGESLTEHASRILRDVQAGHRRLSADLRIANAGEDARARGESREEGARRRLVAEPSSPSPFDAIEVPEWLDG